MHENAAAQTSSVVDGPALGVVVLTIARMPEALQRALQSPTDYARLIACLRSMVATVRRIYNVLCIQVYIEIHKDVYTVNIKKYSCSHIYIYTHIYICIHIYVYMYIYIYMIYMYIYRPRRKSEPLPKARLTVPLLMASATRTRTFPNAWPRKHGHVLVLGSPAALHPLGEHRELNAFRSTVVADGTDDKCPLLITLLIATRCRVSVVGAAG